MTINDLKIAFLGVSHWHVPLYFPGIPENTIVAMSDPDTKLAQKLAEPFGCRVYGDWKTLLDQEEVDFVFTFAPHNEMKDLALELIRRGIPFSIEKPMGMNEQEVAEIAKAAQEADAFCAVPFVWRYSDTVAKLKESILNSKIIHMSYRFIAGPPSRYLVSSPWMLSEKTAGGGCMTNLGVHFLDMALYLTDSDRASVLASSYQYNQDYDIEIYGSSLLQMSNGASLVLETGYAYPMDEESKRENRWCIVTETGYYTLAENCLEAREYGKEVVRIPMSTDSDVYYPIFAKTSLEDFVNGRTPRASLKEMSTVRQILDEMNEAAKRVN